MKKLNVRFERDKKSDDIDIVIRASERDEQVEALLRSLSVTDKPTLTLLDKNNCSCVVDEKDIVFISADGKQVSVTAVNGIYYARLSLQSMEEALSRSFLRVSRFEIINLKMVKKYDFTIGGTLRIEFVNGMETRNSPLHTQETRQNLPLRRSLPRKSARAKLPSLKARSMIPKAAA